MVSVSKIYESLPFEKISKKKKNKNYQLNIRTRKFHFIKYDKCFQSGFFCFCFPNLALEVRLVVPYITTYVALFITFRNAFPSL